MTEEYAWGSLVGIVIGAGICFFLGVTGLGELIAGLILGIAEALFDGLMWIVENGFPLLVIGLGWLILLPFKAGRRTANAVPLGRWIGRLWNASSNGAEAPSRDSA